MSNCTGNQVGCLNGQVNCNDPRCYPNCPNCSTTTSSGNWIIITIILILLGVLLVMAFIIGFDWYKKTKKAAEPKNITVNKHIHNIKQPDVVVSPAVVTVSNIPENMTPIATFSTNIPTVPIVPTASSVYNVPTIPVISENMISMEGISLE